MKVPALQIALSLVAATLALAGARRSALVAYVALLTTATAGNADVIFRDLLLPLILLFSYRKYRVRARLPLVVRVAAACNLAWMAASLGWTPFRSEGVKGVLYFTSMFLVVIIMRRALAAGELDAPTLVAMLAIATLLAAFASSNVALISTSDNSRLGVSGGGEAYGLFVVFISLLAYERLPPRGRALLLAVSTVLVLLSGSRLAVFGLLLWLVVSVTRFWLQGRLAPFLGVVTTVAVAVILLLVLGGTGSLGNIRATQALAATGTSGSASQLGTVAWRLTMYGHVREGINERDGLAKIVGGGAASSLSVYRRYYVQVQAVNVDANRIVHNDLLRTWLELGWIGLVLLVALIGSWFTVAGSTGGPGQAYALLGIVLLCMNAENVETNAGSLSTLGVVMAVAAALRFETIASQ